MTLEYSSKRWLIIIISTVALLGLISVCITLESDGNEEVFLEGSPELVVKNYLADMQAGRTKEAYQYLGSDITDKCPYSYLVVDNSWSDSDRGDIRVTYRATAQITLGVEVEVVFTTFHFDPLFGTNESSDVIRYVLAQQNEGWRFIEIPYPMMTCADFVDS